MFILQDGKCSNMHKVLYLLLQRNPRCCKVNLVSSFVSVLRIKIIVRSNHINLIFQTKAHLDILAEALLRWARGR